MKTKKFPSILALMLWLGLAAPAAFAGQFEDGLAAYKRQDYATAFRLWRPLADQGHAFAQIALGGMYRNGFGVPQDYLQAHLWCNLAAASTLDADDRKGVYKSTGYSDGLILWLVA